MMSIVFTCISNWFVCCIISCYADYHDYVYHVNPHVDSATLFANNTDVWSMMGIVIDILECCRDIVWIPNEISLLVDKNQLLWLTPVIAH